MMAKSYIKDFDIAFLVAFPLVAAFLTRFFLLNYTISILLFFGAPSIYLSIRRPLIIKKTLTFTAIFLVPLVIIIDYLAFADSSWFVPESVLRFLSNSISIEDVLWSILWLYFGVAFWEYFLEKSKVKEKMGSRTRALILVLIGLLSLFFLAYFSNRDLLTWNYAYLKIGLIFVIFPISATLFKFPWLARKVVIIGAYFFFVSALEEYVAMKGGHWFFGGSHYLGLIQYGGQPVAIEEIVFFWALAIPGVICWYEFFVDDGK